MPKNTIERVGNDGFCFAGPDAVAVYRATAIASGLRFYAKTGMKINRTYTPSAMMKAAREITGQTFKARDYEGAADALTTWARAQADVIHAENDGSLS